MKCLKNQKTGNIIRVDDKQAEQMAGNTWKYVAKEEWKLATRTPKQLEVVNDQITDTVTISEKQLKRKKSK
jgi:hypothetical protein